MNKTLRATRIVIGCIALIIIAPIFVALMLAAVIICIPYAVLFLCGWLAKAVGLFIGDCMDSAVDWARNVYASDPKGADSVSDVTKSATAGGVSPKDSSLGSQLQQEGKADL